MTLNPRSHPKPKTNTQNNTIPHHITPPKQELFQKTRYSRIPVFDGEIDKIIGVAMSKVGL
jgi:Mg2+/Co2+ transporter CorB